MSDPPPLPSVARARTLPELDGDALAHCASFLDLGDVVNLSMTCKNLRGVAYSDSVWNRLFRLRWPHQFIASGDLGVREQYITRHTSLHQLKYDDPLMCYISMYAMPHSFLLLDKDSIISAQGSILQRLILNNNILMSQNQNNILRDCEKLIGHGARITCIRLFPVAEASLFRNVIKHEENVILTSSSDWTIRLWWKGRSQRCFKGHNGPVTALSDNLLGHSGSKVLASGGEDCTIRIWSFNNSGKRRSLLATYHGHEKPLSFLTVAGHKDSLLVSISKDSKVKVWDVCASCSSGSSSFVGMTSVANLPVAMKCHEALCYVAAGPLITAIDLRTMRKAFTPVVHAPKIYSFEMLPSKWLICSGGEDRALMWDIRKIQEKPVPVADMDCNNNRVTLLHLDPYKVVTGGPSDCKVNIWETATGFLANSLDSQVPGETPELIKGLTAMAVDGCRIVTAGGAEEPGGLCYRDFSNCSVPASSEDCISGSKFWDPRSMLDKD